MDIVTINDVPVINLNKVNSKLRNGEQVAAMKNLDAIFREDAGYPLSYTCCGLIAQGTKISDITKRLGIQPHVLTQWLMDSAPAEYEAALNTRSNDLICEAIDDVDNISDPEDMLSAKLRSDTKLKAAKLLKPEKDNVVINAPASGGVVFIATPNYRQVGEG